MTRPLYYPTSPGLGLAVILAGLSLFWFVVGVGIGLWIARSI